MPPTPTHTSRAGDDPRSVGPHGVELYSYGPTAHGLGEILSVTPGWPIEPLGETTQNIRSTPDGRLIETRPTVATEAASLADAYAAIEEAIGNVWTMSAEHILAGNPSRAEDRFTAVTHLLRHLAALLDGVMADDPQSIRDAAAWLATNRPEVDG